MVDHGLSIAYSGSQHQQATSGSPNDNTTTQMYEMLTMATHERSSEYQLLQNCTGNQGLSKLQLEEYRNATKNMKRILFVLVLVNTAMLVVITAIAITPLVFYLSQPAPDNSTQNDINILRNQMNQLTATTTETCPRFCTSLMTPTPM